MASLQAKDDLSVGLIWEVFRVLAWNEQGFVVGVRIQRYEVFGESDAEQAVARLEELCAARAT